ncbi:hypothetical protein GCM10010413_00880 [Promicromonospora sukumoe]|uniref:HEPN domain-containing protein n=1 Tax=Promicromonospora sukumoe TaxID=88382 RepID=A0A7W3JEG7_9MICO|nr:HEPN domain-containing protein [Promicromonospora sukumoe]MBA8811344.1 hypothetical protein [Promicromonospora sukumoe]
MAGTTPEKGRWPVGEPEVQNLIDEGELQQVAPSEEHAEFLLGQADVHLASAAKVIDDDPSGALAMLYDAARKAMTAPLARQGLRPTNKNGHRAVQEGVEAQLGPNARKVVRTFRSLRLRRHDSEYPGVETPTITTEEVTLALADSHEIVSAMKKFVPNVGPWH